MRIARPAGLAVLALTAGLGLTGCQTSASAGAEEAIAAAASVVPDDDGGPATLHLTGDSVQRLGIETAPVTEADDGLAIPYAAVVYDPEGGAWAFVEEDAGVYRRHPVTIDAVDGDLVRVSEGPEPGTQVVTVGAAELVGVEAGISGGE